MASSSSPSSSSSSSSMAPILVWFRAQDLRVQDNSALSAAYSAATADGRRQPLAALFVVSPYEWFDHGHGPVKVDFLLRNVETLSQALHEMNVPLLLRLAPESERRGHVHAVANTVADVVSQLGASALYFNKEYEVNEQARDEQVTTAVQAAGVQVRSFDDMTILPPGTLRSKSADRPYKVYGPFKNLWFKTVKSYLNTESDFLAIKPGIERQAKSLAAHVRELDAKASKGVPLHVRQLPIYSDVVSTQDDESAEQESPGHAHDSDSRFAESMYAAIDPVQWPAGEQAAQHRLQRFVTELIGDYSDHRDFPAMSGTSSLSPYLAAGVLSLRQCIEAARSVNHGRLDNGSEGVRVWIQELIWREFYRGIVFDFPEVCRGKPFQAYTDLVEWRYDRDEFARFYRGRTGYPLVDAGIRQLNSTGWMHNRVRMVVASFLTKHLLIDWRWGELYFMRNLIDGDFGSNNGGWQWSASTGSDAQPYFRVFAPVRQSERFDAEAEYIHKFVPELAAVPSDKVHEPWKHYSTEQLEQMGYVPPIVDHKAARQRAIAAFEKARQLKAQGVEPQPERVLKKRRL